MGHLVVACVTSLPPSLPTQADPEDFAEEQWLMGRLVQLFKPDHNDQQYTVSQSVSHRCSVELRGGTFISLCVHLSPSYPVCVCGCDRS